MITPFSIFRNKEDVIGLLDDDNKLIFPICDNLLLLFRKMIDVHDDEFFVVEQADAPILGLFHKQVRLFGHYIDAYKVQNADICMLLNRIIYEAYIKMRYLIDHPQDINEYRALAFKPHLSIINDVKFANTPNIKVIRTKFKKDTEVERISEEDISKARMSPGGKNFRQMQELYEDGLYTPIYSMSSDSIHSGWNEIRQMYLRCDEQNSLYFADLNYSPTLHYRLLLSIAEILISSAYAYFDWVNIKYPGYVPNLTSLIEEHNRVCKLINQVIIDTYNSNPEEFLYK